MKKAVTLPNPPNRDYRYLQSLKADGWHQELVRLTRESIDAGLDWHQSHPWVQISAKLKRGDTASQTDVIFIGRPTVQLIGPKQRFSLSPDRLPIILVDPTAPTSIIQSQLEAVLREARKYIPSAIKKRGRFSLNTRFDAAVFGTWRTAKVVEFADLMIWRATQSPHVAKVYPDTRLAEIAGVRGDKVEVSRRKKMVLEVINALPYLGAQLAHDWHQDKDRYKLIADHVASQLG